MSSFHFDVISFLRVTSCNQRTTRNVCKAILLYLYPVQTLLNEVKCKNLHISTTRRIFYESLQKEVENKVLIDSHNHKHDILHGLQRNLSNFTLNSLSVPNFLEVPLSTRRKWV